MDLLKISLVLLCCPISNAWAELNYSNCTKPAQLPAVATRLVTLDINSTELALALDLKDSIVGIAGLQGPHDIMPEYKEIAKGLTLISPFYPSFNQVQKVNPDLIIGGWKNGFSHGTAMEPEALLAKGIAAYVLRETCATEENHISKPVNFADTLFTDLTEIGRITGKEERARTLLRQMQSRLDSVSADVAAHGRAESIRIFVFDGGANEALSIGAEALLSEAIRLAGGRNIFDDRPGTWQSVDWQEVIMQDPELIIIVDYGSGDAAFKIQDILQNPDLQNISAVRNKRYFIIPYAAAVNGIRSVGMTELLADQLICTFPNLSQGATQCLDVPSVF